jgi:hypothetical protein
MWMAISSAVQAQALATALRDEALKQIEACRHSNDVASRTCKKQDENIQILRDSYRSGDKTVLPVLFRFAGQTDFFDDALIADPEGFLAALRALPVGEQKQLAIEISGGQFRPLSKARFDAVLAALTKIPADSPERPLADLCARAVDENNALLLIDYFPPQSFAGPAAVFVKFWYSRDLYRLGEKSLRSQSSPSESVYRFTRLSSFAAPKTVTMTVSSDGAAAVKERVLDLENGAVLSSAPVALAPDKIAAFTAMLDQADFWKMSVEESSLGRDGAEWILEATQAGNYHVVVRWCPDDNSQSPQDTAFAKAAQMLIEFAGEGNKGGNKPK